jgi:hypothetical protein
MERKYTMAKICSSSSGIGQWQHMRMREEKEPNSSMAERCHGSVAQTKESGATFS